MVMVMAMVMVVVVVVVDDAGVVASGELPCQATVRAGAMVSTRIHLSSESAGGKRKSGDHFAGVPYMAESKVELQH